MGLGTDHTGTRENPLGQWEFPILITQVSELVTCHLKTGSFHTQVMFGKAEGYPC